MQPLCQNSSPCALLGCLLGPTWSLLGAFGGALGHSWAPPGLNLAALVLILAALGRHFGALACLLGSTWTLLGSTWTLLGRSWASLGQLGLQIASKWPPSGVQVGSKCLPTGFETPIGLHLAPQAGLQACRACFTWPALPVELPRLRTVKTKLHLNKELPAPTQQQLKLQNGSLV